MLKKKMYLRVCIFLLACPILLSSYKYFKYHIELDDIIPREVYSVTLELDLTHIPKQSYIKTFLPQSDHRQIISNTSWSGDSLALDISKEKAGKVANWKTGGLKDVLYTYNFDVEGKDIQYIIPKESTFEVHWEGQTWEYLSNEENIQSEHPKIDSLGKALKRSTVLETLKSNFDYVTRIQTSSTRVLTDALSALNLNRASCNGKSRLFTAICRSQNIPARLVGGIILEDVTKRTSHLWTEIYYGGQWVPFDLMNNHFAELPANYLQLYLGDHFLFRHSKDLGFDYQFVIDKKYQTLKAQQISSLQLWPLIRDLNLPMALVRTILLLPLAALLIAILRNVVGVKTFGVLLPALIGLALVNVSFFSGLLAFAIVIFVVALLHFVLQQWHLLHIPKVVIILTSVIITLLFVSGLSMNMNWEIGEIMIFLPIVIISITAERFAKVLTEENIKDASKLLINTFTIAFLTCILFTSKVLLGVFLTFPELYLSILLVMLLLGKWIGMRITEYNRFAPSMD